MDRSNKLAVLMPVFNGGSHLLSTVRSCAQAGLAENTYELIVVDNCSTDDAISKLPPMDDAGAPVHVFRNPANIGRIANWNRAIDHALDLGFQYITFLFVGDHWIPGTGLVDLFQAMRRTGARAGFAPFVVTDGDGTPKYQSRRFYVTGKARVCTAEQFVGTMLRGGMFPLGPLQANLFRVDRVTRPRFDPALPTRTDVQATLDFVRSAEEDVVISATPFLAWREHAGRFHASMSPANIIRDYMETFRHACLETESPHNHAKAKAYVVLNSVRLISKEANVREWPQLLSVVARCSREIPYRLNPLHIVEALWQRFALRRHVLQFE